MSAGKTRPSCPRTIASHLIAVGLPLIGEAVQPKTVDHRDIRSDRSQQSERATALQSKAQPGWEVPDLGHDFASVLQPADVRG